MAKMYLARYNYGFPSLIEFEVLKETPKRIYSDNFSRKILLGGSYGIYGFIEKSDKGLFSNIEDAINYLLKIGDSKIKFAQRDIELAKENITKIQELRRSLS